MKTCDSIRDEFKTKSGRKEVARAIEAVFEHLPPEKILITMYADKSEYNGQTLGEIAEIENSRPCASYVDMVCEKQSPMGVFFDQEIDIIRTLMAGDNIITVSDGWPVSKDTAKPHPRLYGTFPRKLRKFAIEEKILSVSQAVRSMTSMPADQFNLKDRGRLAKDHFADIAVINPETITDRATYKSAHQYSEGVAHLFVNGVQAIKNGKATGDRGGRALKRA